ncbi:MAG: STAS domain-containing protein [Solirubrobacterales bacterium]|nr:STAS domain-containing protein [Solirubrobacterales bacterium]MBV9714986.1 STAS domain-containing protein [Solirubrobacterales bacterium]
MMAEFWIDRTDDPGEVVLTLHGALDLASGPELERCLNEVLAQQHARVLVDLNELTFVDSAGISVLIRAKKQAEERARRLLLRRPTAQVQRLFSVVGLATWLEPED